MKVTLITPTYNRAGLLEETIVSIVNQDLKDIELEYLVIDNNSKDNTKEIVEKYIGVNKNIKIRYLFEGRQGVNYANNTAIEQSEGDYIIFFDDDVVLEKDALLKYIESFREYPEQKIFGGRTRLKMPDFELPKWLVIDGKYVRRMIVISLDIGEKNSLQSTLEDIPLGGNMVVKKEVFDNYGNFRTDLGVKGKKLMTGSEYELIRRFSKNIKQWVYVADAIVYHPIKKEQVKKNYFRKRLFGVGRVTYRIQTFEAKRKIFGLPLYIVNFAIKNFFLACKFKILNKPVESFYYETETFLLLGCVYEHFVSRINRTENIKVD